MLVSRKIENVAKTRARLIPVESKQTPQIPMQIPHTRPGSRSTSNFIRGVSLAVALVTEDRVLHDNWR